MNTGTGTNAGIGKVNEEKRRVIIAPTAVLMKKEIREEQIELRSCT